MKRIQGVVVITALSLLFVAAGCGGGSSSSSGDEGSEETSTTIMGTQVQSHGVKDVSNESEKVEVELDDNYFEPTTIKGTPGQQIRLQLENEGGAEHNFSLDEQGIDQDVDVGQDGEVDVTIPDSGELEFYCKYHRDIGMTGKLEAA